MQYVGIDPGRKGAIGWLDGTCKQVCVEPVPLCGKEYDLREMYRLVKRVTSVPSLVTVEEVGVFGSDWSTKIAFSFGGGYAAWLTCLAAAQVEGNQVEVRLVKPRVWKAQMLGGIANNPEMEARLLEQRLRGHPVCKAWRGPQGGLKDGMVDALWLALSGRAAYVIGGQ